MYIMQEVIMVSMFRVYWGGGGVIWVDAVEGSMPRHLGLGTLTFLATALVRCWTATAQFDALSHSSIPFTNFHSGSEHC